MAPGDDEAPRRFGARPGLARLPVAIVLLAAASLRLVALDRLPPGLHVDEAFNILDAEAIRDGWRPIFLPANAGREAAYSYGQAALLTLGADTIACARLASALIGIVTVAALYLAVRRLPLDRPRRVAVLAAAALALNLWHLHFSRFAIRSIALPLLVIGVWTSWESVIAQGAGDNRPRVTRLAVLAGWLGASVYLHPVGRILWALPAMAALLVAWRERNRRPLFLFLAVMLGALVIALPLLITWAHQPWLVLGHTAETSILGAGPRALLANLGKALGLFQLAGDPAPWRNAPGRPAFDPLNGLLFLAGLVGAARAVRSARWPQTPLLALGLLLVPTVLSDAAPNFSRAIGVLPVACLLIALAMDHLVAWLECLGRPGLGRLAILVWIAVAAGTTLHDYLTWMTAPTTSLAFDDEKAALGRYVQTRRREGAAIFLSPRMAVHPTVRVLAGGEPAGFDPLFGLVLPPATVPHAYYAYLETEPEQRHLLARLDAYGIPSQPFELHLDGLARGVEHRAQATIVDVGRARRIALSQPVSAVAFGSSLELRSLRRPRLQAGATVTLTLGWEVLRTPASDWNRSLRAERPGGRLVAQTDGPPLGGHWPTGRWQRGELVLEEVSLDLPADASGPVVLRVGWYDWRTLEPVPTASHQILADVARLEIEP